MPKKFVAITLCLVSTVTCANTLSLPTFQIEIPDNWQHEIVPAPGDESNRVIHIHGPSAVGTLSIRSLDARRVVSAAMLRNLTNVDASVDLAWEDWGGYSGYHFEYLENGTFFRHWWLAHEQTILLISYECDPALRDIEAGEIDQIVNSIRARPVVGSASEATVPTDSPRNDINDSPASARWHYAYSAMAH